MTKCVYCKIGIEDDRSLDVCDKCGVKVWGMRMFCAIKSNMAASRARGDLEQGNVE